jgi:hypothetical protein
MPEAVDHWPYSAEPQFVWCLHCLRQAISNFDPTDDGPFRINCLMGSINSARCNPCFHDSDVCDMVRIWYRI